MILQDWAFEYENVTNIIEEKTTDIAKETEIRLVDGENAKIYEKIEDFINYINTGIKEFNKGRIDVYEFVYALIIYINHYHIQDYRVTKTIIQDLCSDVFYDIDFNDLYNELSQLMDSNDLKECSK